MTEESNAWRHLFSILNVVNHVLVILVTAYLAYLYRDLGNKTNQHAVLCTIGYVFLMSEAIVALAGENVPTSKLSRRNAVHLHWVFQVVGTVCIIAGGVIKYVHREESKGGTHLTSTHSVIGFVSVVLLFLVSFSGLPAFFAVRLRKRIPPVYSKFVHDFLGTLCYVVGMVSQCFAYAKMSAKKQASDTVVIALTLGTAIVTVLSIVGAARQLRVFYYGIRKSLLGW